jgi:transcriptional regulator with XRE-family HTH domain
LSRTKQALALLKKNKGMSQREAARLVGLKTHSGVGAALRQQKRTKKYRCAHCGSIIPYLKDVLTKD